MKPYLGVVFVTEPWPVSSTHGTGTLLQQVKTGSAGQSCGLRKGDVITEVSSTVTVTP
jgi:S1-C subfamily serine protease